ncbi:replication factor C 37 KD subunit [Thalassiosira pseudonana CCMP1335]|uniref:Replication factor C 37 KD subunit n=1 Tax=Thalassiosira pseudonana TaxID=35128 RepID=B8BYF4_THAPS|nr:replication factor C 37 KD subunit [Thalassiosira pseudonana CCMP1335]EED94365.1 replication factor C 37 KD subunit [Thalassiosira pseudonana CCMP1335]
MLWVDKHRPTRLTQLTYHGTLTARLESLSADPGGLPHLLFYGPPGSGKKTRIAALLRSVFGHGSERLRLDKRTFTTPTNRTVEINMISSNYHIEMSPGDAGLNDRFVIQDVIKEMASSKNIATVGTANNEYKVVVLVEVDKLTRQAQAALRRTMEKYSSSCRLILCCNNPSKVIDPVRSRCLGIRVAAPSHDEIATVLKTVARKESITLPDELAISLARSSNRNLRRALLMLESCHVTTRDDSPKELKPNQPIPHTDWERYISQLASEITREQSPKRLIMAREKLYELLINCIPAQTILKTLVMELLPTLDDSIKGEVVTWAAFYEHRIALGSKEIFHLEAFIAKFMSIYKRYINDMFG